MTVNEVFEKLDAHMKEGIMFHDNMANYYDFLDMMGFKRMHEYHFFCEAAAMRGLNRYFINHFNALINSDVKARSDAIPSAWYTHIRRDIGTNTKRTAVKSAMEAWRSWEEDTKKLYESCYCDLCKLEEVAAACKVKELIEDVDMELKTADRLYIKLQSIDYDLPTIYLMQDEMHENYANKEKSIGVSIC